jgi:hypothetical protein
MLLGVEERGASQVAGRSTGSGGPRDNLLGVELSFQVAGALQLVLADHGFSDLAGRRERASRSQGCWF